MLVQERAKVVMAVFEFLELNYSCTVCVPTDFKNRLVSFTLFQPIFEIFGTHVRII